MSSKSGSQQKTTNNLKAEQHEVKEDQNVQLEEVNPFRFMGKEKPFNPWDPSNLNDPRAWGIVNKNGGLGILF